ncbi:MAG: CCA tRNA nucleotidyltransferase [Clostridia bacterium]|nr:CCA tRNA nucleotidyltransferase [Clostridia bacterium]
MCTSAEPQETAACFEGYRIIETGIKHGTVTVMSEGNPIEITTYRIDGDYKDCRHPESVSFTKNIKEDLLRRDFTVNAMAYSHKRGFVDCCGSREDIDRGIIRCVGSAEERFNEDALRIMRCIRFSAVLKFDVESETEKAAKRFAVNLESISRERIWTEFVKMMSAKDGEYLACVLRKFTSVLEVIMPQIKLSVGFPQNNRHHCMDVWEHILCAVSHSKDDVVLRIALLMHDLGKPKTHTVDENGESHFKKHPAESEIIAREILTSLKADNKTKETVALLVKHHDDRIENSDACVKRWLGKLGEENFFRLIEMKKADISAHKGEYIKSGLEMCEALCGTAKRILEEKQCFRLKDMKINGNDIKKLGVKDGKMIGNVLNILLEEVINENIKNEHETLVGAARDIIDGNR